jgi:hypothetical protein
MMTDETRDLIQTERLRGKLVQALYTGKFEVIQGLRHDDVTMVALSREKALSFTAHLALGKDLSDAPSLSVYPVGLFFIYVCIYVNN